MLEGTSWMGGSSTCLGLCARSAAGFISWYAVWWWHVLSTGPVPWHGMRLLIHELHLFHTRVSHILPVSKRTGHIISCRWWQLYIWYLCYSQASTKTDSPRRITTYTGLWNSVVFVFFRREFPTSTSPLVSGEVVDVDRSAQSFSAFEMVFYNQEGYQTKHLDLRFLVKLCKKNLIRFNLWLKSWLWICHKQWMETLLWLNGLDSMLPVNQPREIWWWVWATIGGSHIRKFPWQWAAI